MIAIRRMVDVSGSVVTDMSVRIAGQIVVKVYSAAEDYGGVRHRAD
jgi:hypothetical protein